jgi:hypothetical protein
MHVKDDCNVHMVTSMRWGIYSVCDISRLIVLVQFSFSRMAPNKPSSNFAHNTRYPDRSPPHTHTHTHPPTHQISQHVQLGVHKSQVPGLQYFRIFFTVVLNVCGPSVWTWFMSHVWCLKFWGGTQMFLGNMCTHKLGDDCLVWNSFWFTPTNCYN